MSEQNLLLDAATWTERWFDGCWRAAAQTGAVIDKATGEALGRSSLATPADLAASARAAAAAHVTWAFTQWQWITVREAPPAYPF